MKKLLAILAVLVLSGTLAWAGDASSNTLLINVTCPTPSVTVNDELGTFNQVAPSSFSADATYQVDDRGNTGDKTVCTVTKSTTGTEIPTDWVTLQYDVTGADVTAHAKQTLEIGTGYDVNYTTYECDAEFLFKLYVDVNIPANAVAGAYSTTYTLTITDL